MCSKGCLYARSPSAFFARGTNEGRVGQLRGPRHFALLLRLLDENVFMVPVSDISVVVSYIHEGKLF